VRSGADDRGSYSEPAWYPLALVGAMLGVAYAATTRATRKIKRGK